MSPQLGALRRKREASVAKAEIPRESAEVTVTTLVNLAQACAFATGSTPHFRKNRSGRRGSNSQLSAWESRSAALYFQYLQNGSSKMYVHALHTVHALPDLRVAGGRLGDGSSAAGFVGSAFQLCRRVRAQLNEAWRRF